MTKLIPAGTIGATVSLTVLFLIISASVCLAQFQDDFSDGDFSGNPSWIADDLNNWIIENGQLKSNSSLAGSKFFISTPSSISNNAQWEFLINLKFNTSGANYVDVFLLSDLADLNTTPTGYFVRIGGTPDEVSLFKSLAGSESIVIDGTDAKTNSSNNLLRIKVTRSASAEWTLGVDYLGGDSYVIEGTVTDGEIPTGNYFGIRITQSTSSFFGKHYFDNLYVGEIILDTAPPSIESIGIVGSNTIDVSFDEPVDPKSAETISNYELDNQVGQPLQATVQSDTRTVRLVFASLQDLITYTLSVSGVSDLSSNVISSIQHQFLFYEIQQALYKDVIFTEIFPDPSPSVGLPETEFVELYNRSEKVFDMTDWKLSDGSSSAVLPSRLLFPNDFVVVTSSSATAQFESFGNVVGVQNFPTLNNSSDNLMLVDPHETFIDVVAYNDTWYRDDDKKQGGFTLELIDPENICSQEDNWTGSEGVTGGTPAALNSVNASKPDLIGPFLISAIPPTANELVITFNENLEASLPDLSAFMIADNEVVNVSFADGSLRTLVLQLSSPLVVGAIYSITVTEVYDCAGNQVSENMNMLSFGLPGEFEIGDVVINEILFNPHPFGADFVEFYNRSGKILNIKDWTIGNYEGETITNVQQVSVDDYLLFPNQYIVVTTDPEGVAGNYIASEYKNFIKTNKLPSFNDDVGSIALATTEVLADYFFYDQKMHSPLLRDEEGVSLERVSFADGTNEINNWRSASSTVGFATPGLPNSSLRPEVTTTATISVEPEIFEPITGQPEFTQIHYNLSTPGYSANVKVLDQEGRVIKDITNNALLGTSGFFTWDGATNAGTRARSGYYIVLVELFDLDGRTVTHKKRVVIASRL